MKKFCKRHDQFYLDSEGCQWCEPITQSNDWFLSEDYLFVSAAEHGWVYQPDTDSFKHSSGAVISNAEIYRLRTERLRNLVA